MHIFVPNPAHAFANPSLIPDPTSPTFFSLFFEGGFLRLITSIVDALKISTHIDRFEYSRSTRAHWGERVTNIV